MVVCFLWSICVKESLRAREMWLMGVYCYVVIGVLIQLIRVVLVYTTDFAEESCARMESDPEFGRPENCVEIQTNATTMTVLFETAIWLAMRLWFILNIRDWRDELKDRLPVEDASPAEAVPKPVMQEMQMR